jgi:hypothetical protein
VGCAGRAGRRTQILQFWVSPVGPPSKIDARIRRLGVLIGTGGWGYGW